MMGTKYRVPGTKGRHLEEEARFLVARPATHDAVARLTRLGEFRLVKRSRERQRNTYFDTEQLGLRHAGSVLKLRHIGRGREVIFKRALASRGHVLRHVEIATPIHAGPFRRLLRNGRTTLAPLQRVRNMVGTRPLRALFTLSTDRRKRVFADGTHRVELAVDAVTLRRGVRVVARRLEVEIENLTASERKFQHAIRALRRQFRSALRPSRVSKFEFAFNALSRGRQHRRRSHPTSLKRSVLR